jgi:crotonobetainyl-CoA:carnitine CoA-transferase CaiB-like acyl-CoA transferase
VTSALSGVRVAAFTHFAAGPLAAQYLGALGADVIKVEAPKLDVNRSAVRDPHDRLKGVSPYFLVTNRNQRCLGVDLKSESGLLIARRLIEKIDVLVENYRPGVMDKLGLGYETLHGTNKGLIYCSFSAYDPTGPGRDRPGQDLLIQALSGLASMSGPGDGPPIPVGAYLIDGFTALQGVIGILSALKHRELTGRGQRVSVDMMSSAAYMMAQEASYVMNADATAQRSLKGIAHVHQPAPYGIYETADGAIAISVFGGSDVVRRAAQALGILEQVANDLTDRRRRTRRDDIAAAFAQAIKPLKQQEAIDKLLPTGIWAVPVRSLNEALTDPALVAADVVKEVESAYGGKHRVVVEPLKMSASPITHSRPAPAPGEHTDEVLTGLGFSAGEIAAFDRQGVTFSAT